MLRVRRSICLFMAAFMLASSPVVSYASAASAVYTAGSFAFKLLLDACGIDMGLSALSSLLGSWDTLDEYREKGEAGELGAFSQYLYDSGISAVTEEAKASYEAQQQALHNLLHSTWGATVSGIQTLIGTLKTWLMSLAGYGTDALDYSVDAGASSYEWTLTAYCTTEKYPLPYLSYGYTASIVDSASYEFVMTSYGESAFSGYAYVRNWFKPVAMGIAGYYDADAGAINFYSADDTADAEYSPYKMFYHYNYAKEDGTLYRSANTSDYGSIESVACGAQYVGSLPFPVFSTLEALADYFGTGAVSDIYEPGKVVVSADAVNADVQSAKLKSIPDSITLPLSADAAAVHAQDIADVFADGSALKSALADAGLVIDWGAGTDSGTGSDVDNTETVGKLSDILAAIQSIPAAISQYLGLESSETPEADVEDLSLPQVVTTKFPFCIPFDIAYLVGTLASEREAPKISIPIEFHYLSFDYSETFVVDFEDWDTAVTVLRVMLDLAFVAGLMVVTRELIRG